VASLALRRRPKDTVEAIVGGFKEHRVLTFANAIAFRIAFALIPLTLAALGWVGSLNAQHYYESHVAPEVAKHVSASVFVVVDQTAEHVLGAKQLWWATLGLAIALWQVSAAVRVVMAVLDDLYETEERRPWPRRVAISLALAVVATSVLLLTVVLVQIGRGILGTLACWAAALVLLAALIAVIVRFAPSRARGWSTVTHGSALTLLCWVVTSLAFGFYLRELASYSSVFGNLATVMIAFEYVYLSSVAFLTGLLVDRLGLTDT
jgi:membrane protein